MLRKKGVQVMRDPGGEVGSSLKKGDTGKTPSELLLERHLEANSKPGRFISAPTLDLINTTGKEQCHKQERGHQGGDESRQEMSTKIWKMERQSGEETQTCRLRRGGPPMAENSRGPAAAERRRTTSKARGAARPPEPRRSPHLPHRETTLG